MANSAAGMGRNYGKDIDRHQTVVRMNAGVPSRTQKRDLGERTDILNVATLQTLKASEGHLRFPPKQIWWSKATKMGDRQWRKLCDSGRYDRTVLWRIPPKVVFRTGEIVGAPPSSGIVLVRVLLGMHPVRLSVFNMDFFGVLGSDASWWHEQRPEAKIMKGHPHDGLKEYTLFRRLGFEKEHDGWWVWDSDSGVEVSG